MRGSPLLRTFLITLCLGLAALPLWHMTRERAATKPDAPPVQHPTATTTVPFSLTLSAPAKRVVLRDESGATLWESPSDVAAEVDALRDVKRQAARHVLCFGQQCAG